MKDKNKQKKNTEKGGNIQRRDQSGRGSTERGEPRNEITRGREKQDNPKKKAEKNAGEKKRKE
jgi:hypothetical protein